MPGRPRPTRRYVYLVTAGYPHGPFYVVGTYLDRKTAEAHLREFAASEGASDPYTIETGWYHIERFPVGDPPPAERTTD